MDYIVRDSSVLPNLRSHEAILEKDTSLRIGIVREEIETNTGLIYNVEVMVDGKMVQVGCTTTSRWGDAHNFEEFNRRPWLTTASGLLSPSAGAKYSVRSGDVVLIAYLNGKSREGVILGGLNHSSRKTHLKKGVIGYLSEFNGLETSIVADGSYKVTFKGYTDANDAALKIPPTGTDVPAPIYNPLTGGSYFGFTNTGSYVASDGSQLIKINKDQVSGSIIIKSGSSYIELGGNQAIGNFSVKSGKTTINSDTDISIKSTTSMALQSLQVSLKGTQIAIGNDQFELFDGLIKLIDAIGTLIIMSPVGTCAPVSSAPTWATNVVPLKLKLSAIKGAVKDANSFELAGDDSADIPSAAD